MSRLVIFGVLLMVTGDAMENSPPTIHLVEFGQSIMCGIEDLYPKPLSIKWKRMTMKSEAETGKPQKTTRVLAERRKEVEGATVSWTVGGRSPATLDVHVGGVTQAGSSFTKTSTLTLEESVWFSGEEVICSTSVDQRKTSDKISVKRGGQRPSIIIYKPHKSVLVTDMVSLVCEVSSPDLRDVFIMWQVNGGQYIEGHSMTSMKKDNTLTVLSYLTVPGQQYNRAEFACAVKHANMENSYTLTTRTTSMRKANCQAPAIINFKIKL
ncbi:hypothetical protein AOLI_G00175990 [Acnodon oligacanthus]